MQSFRANNLQCRHFSWPISAGAVFHLTLTLFWVHRSFYEQALTNHQAFSYCLCHQHIVSSISPTNMICVFLIGGQIYKKVKPLMDALEAAQEAKAAAIADLAKVGTRSLSIPSGI